MPDAGAVVWLRVDPQPGHEQSGHRPAFVISPSADKGKTHRMLCRPMTTKVKGYPFEVRIKGDRPTAVLADQVKSLDWVAGRTQHQGKVSAAELSEVRAKILARVGSGDDP